MTWNPWFLFFYHMSHVMCIFFLQSAQASCWGSVINGLPCLVSQYFPCISPHFLPFSFSPIHCVPPFENGFWLVQIDHHWFLNCLTPWSADRGRGPWRRWRGWWEARTARRRRPRRRAGPRCAPAAAPAAAARDGGPRRDGRTASWVTGVLRGSAWMSYWRSIAWRQKSKHWGGLIMSEPQIMVPNEP